MSSQSQLLISEISPSKFQLINLVFGVLSSTYHIPELHEDAYRRLWTQYGETVWQSKSMSMRDRRKSSRIAALFYSWWSILVEVLCMYWQGKDLFHFSLLQCYNATAWQETDARNDLARVLYWLTMTFLRWWWIQCNTNFVDSFDPYP